MNNKFAYIVLVLLCFSFFGLGQDTVVVQLKKWYQPRDFVLHGELNHINDTVVQLTKRKTVTWSESHATASEMIDRSNYCIFISKDGRRVMEGYYSGEGFYRDWIYYRKNQNIKKRFEERNLYDIGIIYFQIEYFSRKEILRRVKCLEYRPG